MRSSVGIFAVAAMLLATPADARRTRTKAGTELTLEALGWPDTTRSARATAATQVHRKAKSGDHAGKLAKGSRVAWKRIVATRDKCKAWLELEPRGWVCARDLEPSELEPAAAVDPARIVAKVEAKEFIGVAPSGAGAYNTRGDIKRGKVTRKLAGWTFLRESSGTITVGGKVYHRTRRGYVAASLIVPRKASEFSGVDVAAGAPGWPLAWVLPPSRDAMVAVRDAPAFDAKKLREVARREVVVVHETRDGFARIGVDEWIALSRLSVARTSRRPDGVGAGETWIDVDLDQQVLIAYQGDTPIYATLVSTGVGRSTPTGMYRIEKKLAKTRMRNPDVALGRWDVPDVPFSMGFRKHYAMHGAYWHDSFGKKRSHGCVNLTPRDARRVFELSAPHVPDGWISADADDDQGSPVRIRSKKDPTPDWVDYDTEPEVPTRDDLAVEDAAVEE